MDRGVYPLAARLVGLVVKTSASGVKDPGFDSCLRRDFSGSSHTSDLKFDTPLATLLESRWNWSVVCQYTVGEIESLICNFYISVEADPSLRYTSMLLGL